MITKLLIVKEDERGIIYDCGKLKLIKRKKGTISADHEHDAPEILYLIEGEADVTIGNKSETLSSPVKIEIPAHTYHKLIALTDIILLEDR